MILRFSRIEQLINYFPTQNLLSHVQLGDGENDTFLSLFMMLKPTAGKHPIKYTLFQL